MSSPGDLMKYGEFYAKTEDIVQVMLPRIPQKFVEGFEELPAVGETSMAVENLLWTLVDDEVPVSRMNGTRWTNWCPTCAA